MCHQLSSTRLKSINIKAQSTYITSFYLGYVCRKHIQLAQLKPLKLKTQYEIVDTNFISEN